MSDDSQRSNYRGIPFGQQRAEEASEAKAEELRTAIQSKVEQGQSSLGSLPPDDDKNN